MKSYSKLKLKTVFAAPKDGKKRYSVLFQMNTKLYFHFNASEPTLKKLLFIHV